jgi:hypothetical protein
LQTTGLEASLSDPCQHRLLAEDDCIKDTCPETIPTKSPDVVGYGQAPDIWRAFAVSLEAATPDAVQHTLVEPQFRNMRRAKALLRQDTHRGSYPQRLLHKTVVEALLPELDKGRRSLEANRAEVSLAEALFFDAPQCAGET